MHISLIQAINYGGLEEMPLSGAAKVGNMPNQSCLVPNQYSCNLYIFPHEK